MKSVANCYLFYAKINFNFIAIQVYFICIWWAGYDFRMAGYEYQRHH